MSLTKTTIKSIYHTGYLLTPGEEYFFKRNGDKKMQRGKFVNYVDSGRQTCVFRITPIETAYMQSIHLKITPVIKGRHFAKQIALWLSERMPEDCAGIIERMLMGDKIVGTGPDRYESR